MFETKYVLTGLWRKIYRDERVK